MYSIFLVCGLISSCANPADKIVIQNNQEPQHAYVMTLDTSHAPEKVEQVFGSIFFENQYSGQKCMPEPPGMVEWRMPQKSLSFAMHENPDKPGLFEGKVFLDALKDENYFGKGMCAWRVSSISASFKGHGPSKESEALSFGLSMGYEQLNGEKKEVGYYPVSEFFNSPDGNTYPIAKAVPTNDFKLDFENSYVRDETKYFPLYLNATPIEGVSAQQEWEQRLSLYSKK